MTEIATIDWFGRWGYQFSLKTLLYLAFNYILHNFSHCTSSDSFYQLCKTFILTVYPLQFLVIPEPFLKSSMEAKID